MTKNITKEYSDEQLVLCTLKGDTQGFAEIVSRYERPIYNLMYRTCRSEQDAADLTQDVFLRAYERLKLFDGKKRFFPWLYTLALNKAQDWRRRTSTRLRKLSELRWDPPETKSFCQPEREMQIIQQKDNLYSALETLSETSREIIILRYRQAASIKDIASIFDISESAAKMRISRSLEQLKSILGGERDDRGT